MHGHDSVGTDASGEDSVLSYLILGVAGKGYKNLWVFGRFTQ